MVRQLRTGRFGQRLESPQQQPEQITPELIRENPDIPSGRFGRSIFQTRGLQERAIKIRSIRSEAINEAKRLEQDFFSQGITIQQAEEEFANVDPSIRQFIKTTPEVRRQLARQVVNDIDNRIANTRSNIQVLEQRRNAGQGGSNIEIDILEKQQLITELNDLRDEAESGAFTFEQLSKFASSRAEARTQRVEQRQSQQRSLERQGVSRNLSQQLTDSSIQGYHLRQQLKNLKGKTTLSEKEGQSLSPQIRQLIGVSDKDFVQLQTTTRPKTINELVADGIPRDIAIKINSGQSIGLEEYYRLPKIIREQTGLTRKDFEGVAEVPTQTKFQKIINKLDIFTAKPFAKAQARAYGFKEGTQDFEKSVQRTLRGMELQSAFLSTIAGVPKVPKVIKAPIRNLKIPVFTEVQQSVVSRGKTSTLSQFQIVTEVKAPSIVLDSRKAGGFIGLDKKLIKIPSKIELTKTVFPVINQGKVVTLTTKTGKVADLEVLTGSSERINIDQISRLPKTQQLLFKRMVSTKLPVSIKNIDKILSKSQEFNLGVIEKTRLGKVRRGKTTLKDIKRQAKEIKSTGKSINRFETASKFKMIKDTDKFELLSGKILFKDITKPLGRSIGKTPSMKGLIKVMKEPIFLDNINDVTVFRSSLPSSKRTPLSVTFQRQQMLQIPKALPKLAKLKTTQTKALSKITSRKISGVSKLLVGVGSGLNLASRSLNSRAFASGFKSSNIPLSSAQTQQKSLTLTKQLNRLDTTQLNRLDTTQLNKQIPKFLQKESTKTIQKQNLKLSQKQIQKLTLKQINKQINKLSLPRINRLTPRRPRGKKIVAFKLPKMKPFNMPKRMSGEGRSDLSLTESFTARILNFKPLRIKEKDIGKALQSQQNIGRIRLKPLIIPNFTRRKR